MMFFKNKDFDYDVIKSRLETDEALRVSFLNLLMSITPYRKSIVRQIDKKNIDVKNNWLNLDITTQNEWIRDKMLDAWEKKDIVTHITRAIRMLKYNAIYKELFKTLLISVENGKN